MDHHELQSRVRDLVSVEFAPYMFAWVEDSQPSSVFLSLISHDDGTVTATRGDLRDKIEPWLDEDGTPVRFPDESAACDWAWREIQAARALPDAQSAAERARTLANGEQKRVQWEEWLRRWERDGT
ncbi:hypothetical protein ACIPY5_11490 [Microbacterium sp. NPDC089698]|uniref:hypothetical protein n=1 Tax=Microbacterium sp. NPDC089698 TaxID=3364200 RepID=UPI003829117A